MRKKCFGILCVLVLLLSPMLSQAENQTVAEQLLEAAQAAQSAADAAQTAAEAAQEAADAAQLAADYAAQLAGVVFAEDATVQTEQVNTTDTDNDAQSMLPYALLKEPYNPFYRVNWLDQYTVVGAEIRKDSASTYHLNIIAEDTAENVLTSVGAFLEVDMEDSMNYLNKDHHVEIRSVVKGFPNVVVVQVEPVSQDDVADYGEGYWVSISTEVDNPDEYYNDFNANFNEKAVHEALAIVDISTADSISLEVDTVKGYVKEERGYVVNHTQETWNWLCSTYADYYSEQYHNIRFDQGELCVYIYENNGQIFISQKLQRVDTAIKDYIAQYTLEQLGFWDLRDDSVKCVYKDEEAGINVMISKDEWGENPYVGERNAITFSMDLDTGSMMIFYYPDSGDYHILISDGTTDAEYSYNSFTNSYTDAYGGDALSQAKGVAEKLFQKPGTDLILQDAWVTFEQVLDDMFGMNADALYRLEY